MSLSPESKLWRREVASINDREEVLVAARAALRFDEERAAEVELQAVGTGTIAGLPATLTWRCHADGRARLDVVSALPEASAFDGARGMRVGPSRIREPLDL